MFISISGNQPIGVNRSHPKLQPTVIFIVIAIMLMKIVTIIVVALVIIITTTIHQHDTAGHKTYQSEKQGLQQGNGECMLLYFQCNPSSVRRHYPTYLHPRRESQRLIPQTPCRPRFLNPKLYRAQPIYRRVTICKPSKGQKHTNNTTETTPYPKRRKPAEKVRRREGSE